MAGASVPDPFPQQTPAPHRSLATGERGAFEVQQPRIGTVHMSSLRFITVALTVGCASAYSPQLSSRRFETSSSVLSAAASRVAVTAQYDADEEAQIDDYAEVEVSWMNDTSVEMHNALVHASSD